MLRPFLIAVGAVAFFSIFAWLATRYRQYVWSRSLMWIGLLGILMGCFFFGRIIIIYRLPTLLWVSAVLFFAILFGLSAGYFARRSRGPQK